MELREAENDRSRNTWSSASDVFPEPKVPPASTDFKSIFLQSRVIPDASNIGSLFHCQGDDVSCVFNRLFQAAWLPKLDELEASIQKQVCLDLT